MTDSSIIPPERTGDVIRAVREVVEQYYEPRIEVVKDATGEEIPVLVTGQQQNVKLFSPQDFDPFREKPLRRSGTAVLTALESFVGHVNRFKDEDSIIFASDDRAAPSLTAVIDYHRQGHEGDPRFGKHRAHFAFPLSDEWQAWQEADKAPMSMIEFAAFLEDRVIDVLQLIPGEDELNREQQMFVDATGGAVATPSQLIAMSLSLKVNEKATVNEVRNLSTGEGEVQFTSTHDTAIAGDRVRVPTVFIIGIPVFRNGAFYRVLARLRYRQMQGQLKFWYELWRTDRVFDHAFKEACEQVRVETELPLLLGKAE
ncbi:hypothetical protein BSL82_05800 [Tardibacter chloracetimidivorans]|uniref:DUF2303 domain-containing protein n=1 Tax=Tardibacter chloracetimidivorans TaxID=1921510 RepID=A0A1L3ZTC1_9SPHN|nr:DUF2303 family protein [Tardibacter chloracetimidivorans]API58883.1 hypothetical protein BSL82_05800 [Tardibacter chloracetimidivorans]